MRTGYKQSMVYFEQILCWHINLHILYVQASRVRFLKMFLYLHTVTLDKLDVCLFHLESNKFKNSNNKIHCLVKQYEERPDPNIELLPKQTNISHFAP